MNVWTQRMLLLSLAPLLAAQGKYTRLVTPLLPEPPGPRDGCEGSGQTLRLLIAGDSAAAGVGVDAQRVALSGQLAAALAPHFDLHWQLIAQTGYKTRDLLKRLEQEPAQGFDAAVISLGVNDITGAIRTGAWLAQQRQLVDLLIRRFDVQRIVLTSVPPMDQFTALPHPLRGLLGARARHFNACLAREVKTWPACELLAVTHSFDEDALAADRFHPGRSTYRRWALQAAERVRQWADENAASSLP